MNHTKETKVTAMNQARSKSTVSSSVASGRAEVAQVSAGATATLQRDRRVPAMAQPVLGPPGPAAVHQLFSRLTANAYAGTSAGIRLGGPSGPM